MVENPKWENKLIFFTKNFKYSQLVLLYNYEKKLSWSDSQLHIRLVTSRFEFLFKCPNLANPPKNREKTLLMDQKHII